jgi:hypothetical protein
MSFGFKGLVRAVTSLNSVNQLIFVMVKCGVLFEVRTEFLNKIFELRLQRVAYKYLCYLSTEWVPGGKVWPESNADH